MSAFGETPIPDAPEPEEGVDAGEFDDADLLDLIDDVASRSPAK